MREALIVSLRRKGPAFMHFTHQAQHVRRKVTTSIESVCLHDFGLARHFVYNRKHGNSQVADSESVDAPQSPENVTYFCSSRLGVTCHPSAAAKQRFSKPKPNLTLLGVHLRTIRHLVQSGP